MNFKGLLSEWRWLIAVFILGALPSYLIVDSVSCAVWIHVGGFVIYSVTLLVFGAGFVIEGALCSLVSTTLLAQLEKTFGLLC